MRTSASDIAQAPGQHPAEVSVVASTFKWHNILPIAWCDICRVNCDSLEILEQHKNGKQHKKTMQRSEHRQAQVKLMAESLVKNISKPKIVRPWVPEVKTTQVGEANKSCPLVWDQNTASVLAHNDAKIVLDQVVDEAYKLYDGNLRLRKL